MSVPIAEVATLQANELLKADPSLFSSAAVLMEGLQGFLRHASGPRVEEPAIFQAFFDWASLEHNKMVRSQKELVKGFQEGFGKLIASPPEIIYVPFMPWDGYTKSRQAPVTEIVFATLKDTTGTEQFKKVIVARLAATGEAQGCLSWAWGLSIDTPSDAVLIVGWESIEAHEAYCRTDSYHASNMPFIETVSEMNTFHVKFLPQKI